jgi:hypothetical protein
VSVFLVFRSCRKNRFSFHSIPLHSFSQTSFSPLPQSNKTGKKSNHSYPKKGFPNCGMWVDRWHNAHITWNIEHSLTPQRLEQLNACIPPADRQGFKHCLHNTAQLGYELCIVLGNRYEVSWPKVLAERLLEITADI